MITQEIQQEAQRILDAAENLHQAGELLGYLLEDLPGWDTKREQGVTYCQYRIGSVEDAVLSGVLVRRRGQYVWAPSPGCGVHNPNAHWGIIKGNDRIAADICRCMTAHLETLPGVSLDPEVDETKLAGYEVWKDLVHRGLPGITPPKGHEP